MLFRPSVDTDTNSSQIAHEGITRINKTEKVVVFLVAEKDVCDSGCDSHPQEKTTFFLFFYALKRVFRLKMRLNAQKERK